MTEYDEIDHWLPEDLTGVASTNFVENEIHTVARATVATPVPNAFDASYGKTVIISPYCGAFYSTGLTVKIKNPNDANDAGSPAEYRLVGLDIGRTRVSSCKGAGVYRFIHLTGNTSTIPDGYQIIISYHAFGGEINAKAYQHILDLIAAAAQTGGSGSGSSGSGSDVSSETIDALIAKVDRIATRINFNPTKGYTVKRQKSVTTWTNIANSSADLDAYIDLTKSETLHGTGSFDIYSAYVHGTYHFTYEIVPGNVPKCKLTCKVENQKIMDFEPLTSDVDDYFTAGLAIPVFRLVFYNGTMTSSTHKLYLQMAFISNLATAADCSVLVSDRSDFVESAAGVSVNGQIFDAWDMYISGVPGTGLYYSKTVLGLEEYYKIWEGNASLAIVEDVSWTRIQVNHDYNVQSQLVPVHTDKGYVVFPFTTGHIPVTAIQSFRIDVYDRYEEKLITATCLATASKPYAVSGVTEVYGCMNYFMYDNCLLELFYTYDSNNGKSTIRLYSNSGNCSYLNKRFDLRAIYVK